MSIYCGFDFGTSNTVVTVHADDQEPVTIADPTLIYVPPGTVGGQPVFSIGEEAIERYRQDGMQGRLLRSIKSVLSDTSLTLVNLNRKRYTVERLVSLILIHFKKQIEEKVGGDIKELVMGRPVYFSEDGEEDEYAQQRLEEAANLAGFERVIFQYEPIGAALDYEQSLDRAALAVMIDLGGGTSDFTVMRLDPRNTLRKDRGEDVLAIGGVHIGGDDFDSTIMWEEFAEFFGYGAVYESMPGKHLPVPVHYFRTICNWEDVSRLRHNDLAIRDLERLAIRSDRPEAINRFVTLIKKNLGYAALQAVEDAKKRLSAERSEKVEILLDHPDLRMQGTLSSRDFEQMTRVYSQNILSAIDNTLGRAGVTAGEIDAVFLTGGTSLIPHIREAISAKFASAEIKDSHPFFAVSRGLCRYHQLLSS